MDLNNLLIHVEISKFLKDNKENRNDESYKKSLVHRKPSGSRDFVNSSYCVFSISDLI